MEWKEDRLGDVCEIYGRIGFRGYTTNDLVDTPNEGAISLSPKNIINGELNLEQCTYIKWDKYYESPEIMINPNEIVITKTGSSVGRTTFVRRVEHPMTLNPQLVVLKNISENAEFLSYYIKSALFQSVLKSIVVGSAIPTLSQKNLANLKINVPKEVDDQRRIASILSSLDRKIELNNKINADLEEMALAIFKNWFVDFEPFKDGKFVDSELGMIPEGWRVGTLFDIAEIFDKKRKPLSGNVREKMDKIYPYYGATSCMDYVDDYIFDGIYTLIGEDGSVVKENGLPYMQYVWGKMWVNNHAHILQGKNGYSTEMIHALLSITNIKFLVTGAVQAKLSQGNMQKILVAIPPKNVLDEIRPVIDNLYSKIRINTDENSRLSLLRDTLLPRLMSGELEIPE